MGFQDWFYVKEDGRTCSWIIRKRFHFLFVVIFSSLLLFNTGCGDATKKEPSSSEDIDLETNTSVTLTPDNSESRINEFQNKGGLNPAGATFLALTKLEVVSTSKNLYQFTATFPTKNQAKVMLRLTPDQKYTPTIEERSLPDAQAYNVQLTHSITGDTYNVKLQYFFPEDNLPVTLRDDGLTIASIKPLLLSSTDVLRDLYIANSTIHTDYNAEWFAQSSGEETGVTVEFVAVLVEAGKQFAGMVEEVILKEGFGAKDVGNPLGTAIDSALTVIEALNMSIEYQELVAELDELQAAAENPTNPLTQKAYAEDPSVKQQILDEIAEVRSELKWNTLVDYLNTEISVALGLLGSPVLSIAVSPITAWNSKTIKQVNRERINNIRKMITTGYFKVPKTTNNDGGGTKAPNNSTDSSEKKPLPPETWSATYQARVENKDSNYTRTHLDAGAFTFKAEPDFTITGSGNGYVSVEIIKNDDGARSEAQGQYSFTVSGYWSYIGYSFTEKSVSFVFSEPMEIMLTGTSTINDWKKSVPYSTANPGPIIPKGSLKLRVGESIVKDDQYQESDGVTVSEKMTLTIDYYQP